MRRLFKRTVRTAVAMQLVDLAVQAVDGTKAAANATRARTYDAERGCRLLDRLEKAIEDLEAQNEGGEDAPAVHLPEELADKRALREPVRQAMDDLASREGLIVPIEDLEAQNEGGEDAPAVHLPEELADKRAAST